MEAAEAVEEAAAEAAAAMTLGVLAVAAAEEAAPSASAEGAQVRALRRIAAAPQPRRCSSPTSRGTRIGSTRSTQWPQPCSCPWFSSRSTTDRSACRAAPTWRRPESPQAPSWKGSSRRTASCCMIQGWCTARRRRMSRAGGAGAAAAGASCQRSWSQRSWSFRRWTGRHITAPLGCTNTLRPPTPAQRSGRTLRPRRSWH